MKYKHAPAFLSCIHVETSQLVINRPPWRPEHTEYTGQNSQATQVANASAAMVFTSFFWNNPGFVLKSLNFSYKDEDELGEPDAPAGLTTVAGMILLELISPTRLRLAPWQSFSNRRGVVLGIYWSCLIQHCAVKACSMFAKILTIACRGSV